MPRVFQKRSGTWVEIKSIFQKQGGTWTEILNVFQKIGGTWTRVFSGLKVPGNTVAPTITGTGYLFSTLTNSNLGTWTNTPTSYARQWRRATPLITGLPGSYSNISGATSSTYVTTEADNGKYIICQVTATNAVGSNAAASNEIYISKYAPVSLLAYTISGSPNPGSTLTANEPSNAWKSTTTNTDDTYPDTFEFEWSYTDGTVIQSSTLSSASFPRNINSDTLLITTADLNKQIRVRVKGVNTGGEATSSYSTATSAVTQPYRFSFGNILYVSSNGHIGLDSGSSSYTTMSSGRNIAVLVKDLEQYYLAEYSDSSVYYLYVRSYLYNTSASSLNAVDYQIKFYNDPSIGYCDVYMVRVGTNVTLPSFQRGYYNSGNTEYGGTDGASFFIGTGSTVRIYFGNTPMQTTGVSWTTVNDNLWDVIQTWTYPGSGGDDTFTAVTSAANQQAQILTAPTITSVSSGLEGAPVSAFFTGGSGPAYQIYWTTASSLSTTVQYTPDGSGSSSPVTDSTGPSSAGSTYYMYVRSVASTGETSVGPSTVASSWSAGFPFTVTSSAVSQISAPTTRATSTFSTSTVKYLDSITWSAGTYNNAASITSVLLYSTVTSNLVSPGGNTLSSFRTANPYAIVPSDPAGTPYVFAVRDTVVGTNGTTYYFYSNQITSANADAVAFSYGTATSATGGWTASVNSGTQTGATYSYVSATAGSGTVNSSTGAVTASGLSSAQSSTITVNKSVSGYNTASTTVSGTSATVVTYTLSYSANGGSTTPASQTGAQGTSITLAANAGTRSGFTFGGWNIGGVTYSGSGSYTFGSANATATAIWNAVFVEPSTSAPALQFQRTSTIVRWYCDYPFVSNGTTIGMEYVIRTTAGGGTLLASGIRSYPGDFTYPYFAAGTTWAFRMGTSDGDIAYSASARFGRARVVMQGTNGSTYYGAWSPWI